MNVLRPGRGGDLDGARSGRILVVSGYGHVGRGVVETLAPEFPGSVVVAGRDARKAEAYSHDFGGKVAWRTLDLARPASWSAALDGADTVVAWTQL